MGAIELLISQEYKSDSNGVREGQTISQSLFPLGHTINRQ